MCAICGCSGVTHQHGAHAHDGHSHTHDGHAHDGHTHDGHTHGATRRVVQLERDLLDKNDRIAGDNRTRFARDRILALNLVSSPGAGKTRLLERTIHDLASEVWFQVIEGDQETSRDAERIRKTGAPVVQVNTGSGCHLDASMVARSAESLALQSGSVLMIENVGNLVCPALFDLGERAKVVVMSVTEGEDKPLKYPHMFRASALLLLNKIDLLPHLEFDVEQCVAHAREVNPEIAVCRISATTGEGLGRWYGWLREELAHAQSS